MCYYDFRFITGTAGDGKIHLCRKVWKEMVGDEDF